MAFVDQWKQMKAKYESSVKDKKPSEKWLGVFRKSTGIESACKDLDVAIAKGSRENCEKALTNLKKAGETYLTTLDKTADTETGPLKQVKTKTLRANLDDMLTEAHNAIKGLDSGVFDQVVGPDIMSRVMGLKFPKDAYIKSFASNDAFKNSYTTNAPSGELASIQADFAKKYRVCLAAHSMFMANKGKAMQKSEILKVAKATLVSMFDQSGREGMLGIARTWEAQQAKETNNQKEVLAKFLKSTPYQVLEKVGGALNDDAEKLNASIAKLQTIRV